MLDALDLPTALAGFGFGLSLIVAIGAQNAFVLRQGLRGEHVGLVVATCAISDVVLIVAGVAGAGVVLTQAPGVEGAVRVAGAAFLLGYAALALRRAWRPSSLEVDGAPEGGEAPGGPHRPQARDDHPVPVDEALLVDAPPSASTAPGVGPAGSGPCTPANAAADGRDRAAAGRLPVLATALALTWLNPHVYLDTLVLLGSVADAHGDARWAFATGAVVASATWFTGLGRGAAFLRPVFARPAAWRVLDGLVAIVMVAIAGMLLAGA